MNGAGVLRKSRTTAAKNGRVDFLDRLLGVSNPVASIRMAAFRRTRPALDAPRGVRVPGRTDGPEVARRPLAALAHRLRNDRSLEPPLWLIVAVGR